MDEDNLWDPNPKPKENPPDGATPNNHQPLKGMGVIGYNLLVLAVYTVISGVVKDLGPFLDALLLAIHVIVCLVVAASVQKWVWALSALIVLLVGVSTCVGILFKLN